MHCLAIRVRAISENSSSGMGMIFWSEIFSQKNPNPIFSVLRHASKPPPTGPKIRCCGMLQPLVLVRDTSSQANLFWDTPSLRPITLYPEPPCSRKRYPGPPCPVTLCPGAPCPRTRCPATLCPGTPCLRTICLVTQLSGILCPEKLCPRTPCCRTLLPRALCSGTAKPFLCPCLTVMLSPDLPYFRFFRPPCGPIFFGSHHMSFCPRLLYFPQQTATVLRTTNAILQPNWVLSTWPLVHLLASEQDSKDTPLFCFACVSYPQLVFNVSFFSFCFMARVGPPVSSKNLAV